jgi:hypothetical protein
MLDTYAETQKETHKGDRQASATLQSRVPLANNADVVWRVLVLFDVLPVLRADVHTTCTSGKEAS